MGPMLTIAALVAPDEFQERVTLWPRLTVNGSALRVHVGGLTAAFAASVRLPLNVKVWSAERPIALPFSVQLKPALAAAVTVCEPPAANVPPPVTVPAPLGETLSRNTAHTLSNNLLNVRRIKCLPEHSHHRSPQTAPTVHLITRSDSRKDAVPRKRNACR